MSSLPNKVNIVEVGPRDGLQNEGELIPTETKLAFIRALATSGLKRIEATSFVHPKAVPQLADAEDVAAGLPDDARIRFSALVPNLRGLERAASSGITRIALFTAASNTFAERNINMNIERSIEVFAEVARQAKARGMTVRGYISTCFVCPYEGEIDPAVVREVARSLKDIGADEIAISDTIGAAAPNDIDRVLEMVGDVVPRDQITLHLHDTCGTALANVHAGLQQGISTFDSSAGGLGGCPYAPGAAGNLATEDLVYFLDRLGIASGVRLDGVFEASRVISAALGRILPGRQYQRLLSLGPRAD